MKQSPEVRELINQTKKQLEHLRLLGVENIRLIPVSSAKPKERPLDVKQETRIETFEQIHAEIGDCTRCPLHLERTHVVHTEGNRKARLMFVGEAPGADEDAQARPFVGRAGQLLTKIIEAIGLKREEVLIGNVNRCRPPQNRAPMPDEAATCKPFLEREIAIAQPEVIVVLGNTAMKNLLDTREGITRARGRFHEYKGIKVMPTFHPAYLLRDPSKKRETWEDLKKVRDHLDNATQKGTRNSE
jgi:uracil-DNA glycosylase family 4